ASTPRPSAWQGQALPTAPLPIDDGTWVVGAESQARTGDTASFSRVLYQLSYLGPDPGPRRGPSARRRIPRSQNERQSRGQHRTRPVTPGAAHARPAPARRLDWWSISAGLPAVLLDQESSLCPPDRRVRANSVPGLEWRSS